MNRISVTFEEQRDEDFVAGRSKEEDYPDFRFIIQCGRNKTTLYYSQFGVTQQKWQDFAEAVQNNTTADICFLESNGNLSIDTKDGMTCFSVSKYGGDNCGSAYIEIENCHCNDAITEAKNASTRYHLRKHRNNN